MGDKEDNLFNDKAQLAIFIPEEGVLKPIGMVVKDSTNLKSEETETVSLVNSSIGFDVPMDMDMVSTLDKLDKIDLAAEPSEAHCLLVIKTEPKIIKPKHLKYPNKRRKLRVLKKWKRRFGVTPAKALHLPFAKMECIHELTGVNIKVKPI